MGFPGSTRLTRLAIGACLTLLIQALCASQSARAGCGHLVDSRSHQSSELSKLDPQLLGGSLASSKDEDASRPDRRFPCSGPSCSGNVPLPVSPGVVMADRLHQWGALSTLFGFSPVIAQMIRPSDATPRPIGQPTSIFHPPRMIGSIIL